MMSDNFNNNISENTEVSSEEDSKRGKHPNPFGLLFEILLTGSAGWKSLRRSRLTPEQTAAGCFYPLVALASICRFCDWFYLPEFNLSTTLISAASVFVSFFFSYFAVLVVCRWLYPIVAKSKAETPYFKLVVQYSLASLALFWIPAEILPILEPLAVLLPIWTAFIITKGLHFLRLPDECHNRCMVTTVVTTIVMPYILMALCETIFKIQS